MTSLTSGDAQNSHDADDGGVDGHNHRLHLFKDDANNRQDDDQQVKDVPPETKSRSTC